MNPELTGATYSLILGTLCGFFIGFAVAQLIHEIAHHMGRRP